MLHARLHSQASGQHVNISVIFEHHSSPVVGEVRRKILAGARRPNCLILIPKSVAFVLHRAPLSKKPDIPDNRGLGR
jgi:hypothetical protein